MSRIAWAGSNLARLAAGDIVPALALAALSQVEVWSPGVLPGAAEDVEGSTLTAAVALVTTLSVAFRRRLALGALTAVTAGVAVQEVVATTGAVLSSVAALIITTYSVAAYSPRRAALLGAGVVAVAVVLTAGDLDDVVWNGLLLGAFWVVGRVVSAIRRRAAQLEELMREVELEREEKARLAVALERARIARELHDVVAHAISVMVVQAQAAQRVLEGEQASARESLAAVERTGRQALVEMRRLLGMLRREDRDFALAPRPSLAHLDALVSQVREAGLPVELHVEGEPAPLSAGVELSAYRIVQEALTNTLKHAGPARAQVIVRYRPHALELEVSDDGRGPVDGAAGGHGLVGIRERAALVGGSVESGPANGRGYVVRASLPA